MKEIILKVLSEIACGNTGSCQINMQSESAREMIANKLSEELEPYVQQKMTKLLKMQYVGLNMDQEEYIKNLLSANQLIGEDILNNDNFTEEELTEVRDRISVLIEQLEFWIEQDNPERFCYELKNHIQWMIKNYS